MFEVISPSVTTFSTSSFKLRHIDWSLLGGHRNLKEAVLKILYILSDLLHLWVLVFVFYAYQTTLWGKNIAPLLVLQ